MSQYKAARSSGDVRSLDMPLFFSNLLSSFRFKDATDPRDKVYGILNLALLRPELDYLLRPDYTSTVECVYIRSANTSSWSREIWKSFNTVLTAIRWTYLLGPLLGTLMKIPHILWKIGPDLAEEKEIFEIDSSIQIVASRWK
jgi:hypothetical protein